MWQAVPSHLVQPAPLDFTLKLSRSLLTTSQRASALSTISFLETKVKLVNSLESLVHTSQAQTQSQVAEAMQERASLTTLVNEWNRV